MNKDNMNMLMNNGIYGLYPSMLAAGIGSTSHLTPEEKVERALKAKVIREEEIRIAKILQNVCPDCSGKLVRGKKDKRNDYKRVWTCKVCAQIHLGG